MGDVSTYVSSLTPSLPPPTLVAGVCLVTTLVGKEMWVACCKTVNTRKCRRLNQHYHEEHVDVDDIVTPSGRSNWRLIIYRGWRSDCIASFCQRRRL